MISAQNTEGFTPNLTVALRTGLKVLAGALFGATAMFAQLEAPDPAYFIAEVDGVKIYKAQRRDCSTYNGRGAFDITLEFPRNAVIPKGDEYLAFFLTTVLPAVQKACPHRLVSVKTNHYFEGYRDHPHFLKTTPLGRATLKSMDYENNPIPWKIFDEKGFVSLAEVEATVAEDARKREEAKQEELQRQAELQRAREAAWSRDPCSEANRQGDRSSPSPHAVCSEVAEQIADASTSRNIAMSLLAALSDDAPRLEIRLVEFALYRCTPAPHHQFTDRVRCVYRYQVSTRGTRDAFSALLRNLIAGSGRGEIDFEQREGQWVYAPPPYDELPPCWQGDVRVRWGDCQED